MTTDPASILPAIACTDCLVTSGLCVYTSGPNAGKPRAARYGPHKVRVDASVVAAKWYDRGVSAGAASRQPDVDAARTRAEAAEAAVSKGQADVAALKQQLSDANDKIAELERPPVVVVEPKHPIPAGAVTIAPGQPLKVGAVNVLTGTWPGFHQMLPNDTETTIIVPDGQTAILDGKSGIGNALTAGGKLHIYGDLQVNDYAPTTTGVNASGCAVFYGGTAAGSTIDGLSINRSKSIGFGFAGKQTLTRLLVDSAGHSGILGTLADSTTFGDVRVFRINRGGHAQDGQLGAIKMTKSADLVFSPGVHVEDFGAVAGVAGLWTDWSSRRPVFNQPTVKTGAGVPANIGINLEQTEGGLIVGATVEAVFGISLRASGHVRAWLNQVTATNVAMQIGQDRNPNSGAAKNQPPGAKVADVPWTTIGNEVCNNYLAGKSAALFTFTRGDGKGLYTTAQMVTALKGNHFSGTLNLEGATLASLGAAYDPAAQPVPEAVAGLLA